MAEKKIDVVIIGGSPAGLACANNLVNKGLVVLLLEASKEWHAQLDNNLAGLRYQIEANGGEILTDVPVVNLRPGISGRGFHIRTGYNYIHAHYVVLATSHASSKQLVKLSRWHRAGLYQISQSRGSLAGNMARGRQTAQAVLKDINLASEVKQRGGVWLHKRLSKQLGSRQQLHKQLHQ